MHDASAAYDVEETLTHPATQRSIRNMDIKTFAETYKGQIFAALRQEVNKKQKELDSWVRATPRLKKNAIDETKQIRRKYNLRSSARKVRHSPLAFRLNCRRLIPPPDYVMYLQAVRRSARIANKQKSRLKVTCLSALACIYARIILSIFLLDLGRSHPARPHPARANRG